MEFDRAFGTESACRAYLLRLRWPEGFQCPRCGHGESWAASRGRLVCRRCQHQTWITAGTVFHRSHQPLPVWFKAIWWMTSQKIGVSALSLQRVLGLGSYETAWLMLHKLRRAMVRPGREALEREVEVDEAFVGGKEPGVHGRETLTKALVAIAAEVKGRGIGRIRLQRIPNASQATLAGFVRQAVAKGAVVRTDGWDGYATLPEAGYRHRPRPSPSGDRAAAGRLLPRVHRVASLLKRWLLGTHQGRVDLKHLPLYLDEFVFRFNRRTSSARGQLFYRVLQHAVALPPTSYRQVIQGRVPDTPKQ